MEGSATHRHRASRLAAEEEAAELGAPELSLPALPELDIPLEIPRLPEVDLSHDASFQNYLAQQTQLLLAGCCATSRPKASAVGQCGAPEGADQAADAARAMCTAGVAYAGCSAPPDIDRGSDAPPRRNGQRSPVPRPPPQLPLPYRSSRSPVQGLPGEEEEAELRRAARRGRIPASIAPFGDDSGNSQTPAWAKPKEASTIFGDGVADGGRVDGCGL